MDFSFTEEQQAIRELARQILADGCRHERLAELENAEDGDGYDAPLWRALADANLLGVAIPEAYGGSELGLLALIVLLEEAGHALAPLPLLPTLVMGALPLARFGSSGQCVRWLPGVAAGDVVLGAALQEVGASEPARPRTRARKDGPRFVLSGEKTCVAAARSAARLLVPARVDGGSVGVFMVDPTSAGVTLSDGRGNNNEHQYAVTLDDVAVGREDVLGDPGQGEAIVHFIDQHAQVALCAMQVGVASAALARTAQYTATRKQFGRPIGTFQAVTMRAADAFIDIEAMRSTLWQAVWRLESGLPATIEVAAAKWWACRGGQRVVHTAQHLHGGIGADVDYPIHRYFLWARQLELTLGGAGVQLARLGRALAQAG